LDKPHAELFQRPQFELGGAETNCGIVSWCGKSLFNSGHNELLGMENIGPNFWIYRMRSRGWPQFSA
jgi:hypothetical protein